MIELEKIQLNKYMSSLQPYVKGNCNRVMKNILSKKML